MAKCVQSISTSCTVDRITCATPTSEKWRHYLNKGLQMLLYSRVSTPTPSPMKQPEPRFKSVVITQLLARTLRPLPIPHARAACQQPTVSATLGRFHHRRDDTKSAHSVFPSQTREKVGSIAVGICHTVLWLRACVAANMHPSSPHRAPPAHSELLCCTADVEQAAQKMETFTWIL